MAFEIDSNDNIIISQGDTGSITIEYNIDGVTASLLTGDTIRMIVKKAGSSINLFEKEITNFVDGKAIISISQDDSNNTAGVYHYKIRMELQSGQIHTLIPRTCDGTSPTFKICGE